MKFWPSVPKVQTERFSTVFTHPLIRTTAMATALFTVTNFADAQSNSQDMEARISELEELVDELTDQVGSQTLVHSYDSLKFDIGGFLHTAYTALFSTDVDQDGFDDPASVESFNRTNFELLMSAQLKEDWSAFIAAGFLRESADPFGPPEGSRTDPNFNNESKAELIMGWANYHFRDYMNFRVGRMITPHGVVNIEHFPSTLLDPEQPQFLRPFSGNTIFPNFTNGVQMHGNQFYDGGMTSNYAVYFGNSTHSPEQDVYGGRFAMGFDNSTYEVGINTFSATRDLPFVVYGRGSDRYYGWGADFKVNLSSFLFKSEYFRTTDETAGDRDAFYAQPAWVINDKWITFYRLDLLSAGDLQGDSTENVIGVNYLANTNVRLRATYTFREMEEGMDIFQNPLPDVSTNILQFSGTFSF